MGKLPRISRRGLLIGGASAGGLLIAWALWPRRYLPDLVAAEDEQVFGAYLKIARDGRITVAVPQCEMGQGVYTVLPQILADELGADWRTIAVEPAPVSPVYHNAVLARSWIDNLLPPDWQGRGGSDWSGALITELAQRERFMVTADGSSLSAYGAAFREAGAAARVLLSKAAAARWDAAWESLEVADGFVKNGKQQLRFGELADDAATLALPDPLPLRAAGAGALLGRDLPRLDLPAKLDGSLNFAGDIRLPDMVYAAIRQGPIGQTRLKSFTRDGARRQLGLIDIIDSEHWIAAVATNWWAANQALDKLAPIFTTQGMLADSGAMETILDQALADGPARRFAARGAPLKPMFDSLRFYEQRYQVLPAHHAPMETRSATAHLVDGRLQLWLAAQAPAGAIAAAARGAGLPESAIVLIPVQAGGSFGGLLDHRIAEQVAMLAVRLKRPVQLIWSRAEEMIHDAVRPPAHARLSAAMDANKRVQALQIKIATPAAARETAKRVIRDMDAIGAMRATITETDRQAVAGADPFYDIANVTLDHHAAYIGMPTGNMRARAHSYTAFFMETFIDELAGEAGVEPLSYRMQYLGQQARLARCLTGVAAMARWDGGLDNSGQGLACHAFDGGHIAMIASARRSDSGLKVRRISAMVDIGRIVHPDIARQQIEGGIVFGLAMAMGASIPYEQGLPTSYRLRDLALPRLAEVPEIQVEFVKSDEEPGHYEELGVPATAPAVANALHSATGVRFRRLPLFSETL